RGKLQAPERRRSPRAERGGSTAFSSPSSSSERRLVERQQRRRIDRSGVERGGPLARRLGGEAGEARGIDATIFQVRRQVRRGTQILDPRRQVSAIEVAV